MEVTNKGGYTARFRITYSSRGQDIVRNSPAFNLFQTETLITPYGVNNIRLNAEYLAFIGVWRPLFDFVLPSTSRCFDVYGTVFNPSWSPRNC